MTDADYNVKLKELKLKHEKEIRALRIEFALSNNDVKVGDKFTDHIGTIIVEDIKVDGAEKPSCVYFGVELKKDGTPRKDGGKRYAFQVNKLKA